MAILLVALSWIGFLLSAVFVTLCLGNSVGFLAHCSCRLVLSCRDCRRIHSCNKAHIRSRYFGNFQSAFWIIPDLCSYSCLVWSDWYSPSLCLWTRSHRARLLPSAVNHVSSLRFLFDRVLFISWYQKTTMLRIRVFCLAELLLLSALFPCVCAFWPGFVLLCKFLTKGLCVFRNSCLDCTFFSFH